MSSIGLTPHEEAARKRREQQRDRTAKCRSRMSEEAKAKAVTKAIEGMRKRRALEKKEDKEEERKRAFIRMRTCVFFLILHPLWCLVPFVRVVFLFRCSTRGEPRREGPMVVEDYCSRPRAQKPLRRQRAAPLEYLSVGEKQAYDVSRGVSHSQYQGIVSDHGELPMRGQQRMTSAELQQRRANVEVFWSKTPDERATILQPSRSLELFGVAVPPLREGAFRIHTGRRKEPRRCGLCGQDGHNRADAVCPLTPFLWFVCAGCGKCFLERLQLKKHEQRQKCWDCGHCFRLRKDLKAHDCT